MPAQDDLDEFVNAAAKALQLPLDPSWQAAVRFNLDVSLEFARLVNEFPLPDETEPAPVFKV
jgi:hypothetical protein